MSGSSTVNIKSCSTVLVLEATWILGTNLWSKRSPFHFFKPQGKYTISIPWFYKLFGHEKSCWTSWAIVVNIVHRHSCHTNLVQSSLPACWISWNSSILYSNCNKIKYLAMSTIRQNQMAFPSIQWWIFCCMWRLHWAFFCCFKQMQVTEQKGISITLIFTCALQTKYSAGSMSKQPCASSVDYLTARTLTSLTEAIYLQHSGNTTDERLVTGSPLWLPWFIPGLAMWDFGDKVELGQVFSVYLTFHSTNHPIQKFYSKSTTQLFSINTFDVIHYLTTGSSAGGSIFFIHLMISVTEPWSWEHP